MGGGYKGRRVYNLLKNHGICINGWLDINHLNLNFLEGYPVYEPTEERCKDAIVIISLTDNRIALDIYEKCKQFGVLDVYLFNDYAVHPIGDQYFDFDIIKFKGQEAFVDAGAFDLATSREFLGHCKRKNVAGFVYAFEPDGISYEKCLKKISSEDINNIQLINACLWSEKTSLSFEEEGTGSSAVSKKGKAFVKALPLDGLEQKKCVTFIKMDIEGAELNALRGARETILKNHPKLAICLYHKPEDIYDIPIYIKQLDPTYKLFIRHYSNYITETVLYAI